MSRKSTLDALFGLRGGIAAPETRAAPAPGVGSSQPNAPSPAAADGQPTAAPLRTGAVAAIGQSLQRWGEAQRTAEALQAQLADAVSVVELDPATVEPAPVPDRIPDTMDPAFEALVASIAANGQQVPILVRPHPERAGWHQAAYGHRRLRAAQRLGRPVRAIVAALDDRALMVAQAKENSERLDLSFIERARFAARLEAAGHGRAAIGQALGLDKGDLSRFIQVAKALPDAVIDAIGPAPKAGRARWLALTEALRDPSALKAVTLAVAATDFAGMDSDRRFQRVLAAATGRGDSASPARQKAGPRPVVTAPGGQVVATLEETRDAALLRLDETVAPGFAAHLAAALPDLWTEWRAGQVDRAASPPVGRRPAIRRMDT